MRNLTLFGFLLSLLCGCSTVTYGPPPSTPVPELAKADGAFDATLTVYPGAVKYRVQGEATITVRLDGTYIDGSADLIVEPAAGYEHGAAMQQSNGTLKIYKGGSPSLLNKPGSIARKETNDQ